MTSCRVADDLSIISWEVGAWWVGFPVFASILFLLAFTFLPFPRWLREPNWLLYRRYRALRREYRRQQREQEARRRRRRKKREAKMRERERRDIRSKAKRTSNTLASGDDNSSPAATSSSNAHESDAAKTNSANSDVVVAADVVVSMDSKTATNLAIDDINITAPIQSDQRGTDSASASPNDSDTDDETRTPASGSGADADQTTGNATAAADEPDTPDTNSAKRNGTANGGEIAPGDAGTTGRRYKSRNSREVRVHFSAGAQDTKTDEQKHTETATEEPQQEQEKHRTHKKLGKKLKGTSRTRYRQSSKSIINVI